MRTTLTSKGQVTIPIDIRAAYNLDAGDSLEFIPDGDELRIRVIKRHSAKQLRGLLVSSVKFLSQEAERGAAARSLGAALGTAKLVGPTSLKGAKSKVNPEPKPESKPESKPKAKPQRQGRR